MWRVGRVSVCSVLRKFRNHGEGPYLLLRAFSWLKAPTSAFTFKTLLRHYAKRMLVVSVYECVPIQNRSGVSFIQHLNVVRHLATSATETFCSFSQHVKTVYLEC